MDIQFIPDEPALTINKILVIADLHIGIEYGLKKYGFYIPDQTKKIKEKIINLLEKTDIKKILILGDVKHAIGGISNFREISKMFEQLSNLVDIEIVPGNHDGNLKKILTEKIKIQSSNGIVINNIGFIHGHAWPKQELMDCKYIVMGHAHPVINFYRGYSESVWIISNLINAKKLQIKYKRYNNKLKIIIMPAFNELSGKKIEKNNFLLGPVAKLCDLDNAIIYLLNGVCLGTYNNLSRKNI